MPADLLPDEAIATLAAHVRDANLLETLERIERIGVIQNRDGFDADTVRKLQRLGDLGLVDRGYQGAAEGVPFHWISNQNGLRVLRRLTGIEAGPHYQINSTELADWIEERGVDQWWFVDGDPLLTGRLSLPCPADELAAELRKINRKLSIQAKTDDAEANGQPITKEKLDELAEKVTSRFRFGNSPTFTTVDDCLLYMCWKGSPHEWLLGEDSRTAAQMNAETVASAS